MQPSPRSNRRSLHRNGPPKPGPGRRASATALTTATRTRRNPEPRLAGQSTRYQRILLSLRRNQTRLHDGRIYGSICQPLANTSEGAWYYRLNPTVQPSHWWAHYSALFDKFRFVHLSIRYVPAVSSMSNGAIAFYYDPGSAMPPAATFATVSQSYNCVVTPIHTGAQTQVPYADLHRLPWYDSHSSSAAGDNGQITVAWTPIASTPSIALGQSWGYIEVHFVLETEIASASYITPIPALTMVVDSNNGPTAAGLSFTNPGETKYIDDPVGSTTWIVPPGVSNHTWPRLATNRPLDILTTIRNGDTSWLNAIANLRASATGSESFLLRTILDGLAGRGVPESRIPSDPNNGDVPLDTYLSNAQQYFGISSYLVRLYLSAASTRNPASTSPFALKDVLAQLPPGYRLRYVHSHSHLDASIPSLDPSPAAVRATEPPSRETPGLTR